MRRISTAVVAVVVAGMLGVPAGPAGAQAADPGWEGGHVRADEQGVFRNNLSFRSHQDGALPDFISGDVDHTNFLFNGALTMNNRGLRVVVRDFANLAPPAGCHRAADGGIFWGDFLRLSRTSKLNVMGTDRGHVGALPGRERYRPHQ